MGLSTVVQTLFEDKRATITLVIGWGVVTIGVFWCLGAFHIQFMTFGPSDGTKFMGLVVDTWPKWSAVAVFSFANTAINAFLSNALVPWFTNTIQDHKTKHIPYSKTVCLLIIQAHTVYCHVMGSIALLMFFTQVDFLLLRMLADLLVTHYTTIKFLDNKTVDAGAYAQEFGPHVDAQVAEVATEHHADDTSGKQEQVRLLVADAVP